MNTLEILKAARALLTPPEAWAKNDFAFDSSGNLLAPSNKYAVSWCATGACIRAGGKLAAIAAARELSRQLGGREVFDFNDRDETTHADVLQLFDDTIARLERA